MVELGGTSTHKPALTLSTPQHLGLQEAGNFGLHSGLHVVGVVGALWWEPQGERQAPQSTPSCTPTPSPPPTDPSRRVVQVSNQPITMGEFEAWQRACKEQRRPQISTTEVAEVRGRLLKADK